MSGEKKQHISRMFQSVALELFNKRIESFSANVFAYKGVGISTIAHRLDKVYKLPITWVRMNSAQHKRTYRVEDLIAAMKREGDWG